MQASRGGASCTSYSASASRPTPTARPGQAKRTPQTAIWAPKIGNVWAEMAGPDRAQKFMVTVLRLGTQNLFRGVASRVGVNRLTQVGRMAFIMYLGCTSKGLVDYPWSTCRCCDTSEFGRGKLETLFQGLRTTHHGYAVSHGTFRHAGVPAMQILCRRSQIRRGRQVTPCRHA